MSLSWKNLPLSVNLTLPLVLMLFLTVSISGYWMVTNFKIERLAEIDHTLDAQADTLVDAVIIRDNTLDFDLNGETASTLYRDKLFYSNLTTIDADVIAESKGPSADTRERLSRLIAPLRLKDDEIVQLDVDGRQWRVISVHLPLKSIEWRSNKKLSVYPDAPVLNAAVDISPVLKDIRYFKNTFSFGAFLFICITSFATWLIVVRSTSNLRAFSHNLNLINPQNPSLKSPITPKSAEELLLFKSFDAMLAKIRRSTEIHRLFVASASHELKTPVSGMLTALQVTLLKPRSVEEYKQTCEELLKSVLGLQHLSGALLNVARLDNIDDITTRQVTVRDIIKSLQIKWQPIAAEKNILLCVEEPEQIIEFATNPELFEIAIGNFLQNAIKYSNPASTIYFSYNLERNDNLVVRVKDQGIGMSKDDVDRLGNVFFRGNEARPDDCSYGLGFALAQRIVTMLHGSIQVISLVGKGTEVIATFRTSKHKV